MGRIIRSPESDNEIYEIALYIAQDSPSAAYRFLERVDNKLALLAEMPGAGRARPEYGKDLRSMSVDNYLIFYRPVPDGIEVVHVVDGRRDLPHFFES